MTPTKIRLGEHEVDVFAQRHAYLENKLGKWFAALAESSQQNLDVNNLLAFLGGQTYDVLVVMIPTLGRRMPRWEFDGYGSQEAWEAKDYDEQLDKSPTVPEIVNAFEVAIQVNRFNVFGALTKIVDPRMLRALVNERLAATISQKSQSSLPPSGESDPTSSGTTPPTSTPDAD
jgi:hypothetical protein